MGCQTEDTVYNWNLVAGDDSTRTFEYRDSDDVTVDLTGYTAVCTYDVGTVSGSVTGSVDGPNGTVTITLDTTLTSTFLGNGEYKVKLTSGGGRTNTLVYGDLVVKQ